MDPSTAVQKDTLPAIATLVAPGALATAPYLWWGLSLSPTLTSFLDRHEAIALAAAILIWIAAGFAIESIGSYVEFYCIDRAKPDHAEMVKTWWQFLRIAWNKEPIGDGYVRQLVASFKFELNMFVATLACAPGVILLAVAGCIGWFAAIGLVIAMAVSAPLLFCAARDSSTVLADARKRLVLGVGEPPFDQDDKPSRPALG